MATMQVLLLLAMVAISGAAAVANDYVSVQPWGRGGALLYTLSKGRTRLSITDWGATVTSFQMFDPKTEKDVDVVLGFDTLEPYTNGSSPYFGTTVGRVANRIKNATFTLNGTTYTLTANDHGNTLHGGFIGYNNMFWRSRVATVNPHAPAVQFLLYSYDTEQGFPGDIDVSVTFTLSKETELSIEMEATTRNKMTPVNLAHHTYWNLGGHDSGSIINHTLQISASRYTPVDQLLIPTGQILPVHGTPFDFQRPTTIGSRINSVPGGYDHNFALDGSPRNSQILFHATSVEDPVSGRKLEILTNQPGVQFYAGNQITKIVGKGGAVYTKHSGLCLETQGFPNAVNQPNFPSVILKPGELYSHTMLLRFSNSHN